MISLSTEFEVVDGRHPSVEAIQGDAGKTFVSNDCNLSEKRFWLVTGYFLSSFTHRKDQIWEARAHFYAKMPLLPFWRKSVGKWGYLTVQGALFLFDTPEIWGLIWQHN